MKTYKAIIVDDETAARENLKDMLAAYCPRVQVVQEAQTVNDACQIIVSTAFDILFLDINLGSQTGFDVLKQIDNNLRFHTVFTTAYDEYAITAFKYAARDYLLKPISKTTLLQAIEKIDALEKPALSSDTVYQLLMQLQKSDTKKFLISTKEGWDVIHAHKVMYLSADGSYTTLFLENGKSFQSSKNLKYYQGLLAELSYFLRVHKSYIVNTLHIIRIVKSDGGSIVMTDGNSIPLSTEAKELVYNLYKE
jgi:two-component system LytT family response regulator